MMNLAETAVSAALESGASYADARVNRVERQNLSLRNGALSDSLDQDDFGVGVRVIVNGAWGFGAAPGFDAAAAKLAARRAVGAARNLSPLRREPVKLSGEAGSTSSWTTPVETDPFTVSLADKLAFLVDADKTLQGREETVVRIAGFEARREEQWQASSEGARLHQRMIRAGAGISNMARVGTEVERRSWPASFGGNYRSAGWEYVEELGRGFVEHGPRIRDEAIALCTADVCPAGERDLILMGNQLMLQIHESVGHPNEIDRVHGHEVDLAGASFATMDKGAFRYGSPIVNLVADPTARHGLDTRGFDDDGVASAPFDVVREGEFKGYHTDREWAGRLGLGESHSTSRAEGWFHPPIVRITNLSLMPGTWNLDALVADTADGVLCDTVKMWSIDQRRVNFQFTTELGWEIKDGEKTRMLRRPTYQGSTVEFWNSCDAICDESHYEMWGVANCGKGNPMQVAEMSHGAAPARFKNITFVA